MLHALTTLTTPVLWLGVCVAGSVLMSPNRPHHPDVEDMVDTVYTAVFIALLPIAMCSTYLLAQSAR